MQLQAMRPDRRPSMLSRVKQIFQRGSFVTSDPRLAQFVGSVPTRAGKPATIDSALQLATVWACVRLISETIATLPLFLYRRNPNGGRTLATDHPLYAILHDAPNADYTAVEFWEIVAAHLLLWGNFYGEKQFAGARLVGVQPLDPARMKVERDSFGARRYRYSEKTGQRILTEDSVMHIRGFGIGGDTGLSPIGMARESIGTSIAAEEAAARMFSNGMMASLILTIDNILKPDQREDLRKNVIDRFTGSMNAGGVFLAEGGMKPQQVSMNPEDVQFLETRRFHVEELCRWFRVPPFMVGHTDKTTSWGRGIEQQMIGFLTFALRPYLTRIEQSIKRALIAPAERAALYAEFEIDGLLRSDSKTRTFNLVQRVQNGLLTRNEGRAIENWPALPGGDVLTVQSQNIPVGTMPDDPANDSPPQDAP